MRPRPKSAKQILSEKWPNQQVSPNSRKYNSDIASELALYIPESLKDVVVFKSFDNSNLVVTIPSANYQMQFNAIKLNLMSNLRKKFPQLINIKCQVEPSRQVQTKQYTASKINPTAEVNQKKLSKKATESLTSILPDLPEELGNAIKKLLK